MNEEKKNNISLTYGLHMQHTQDKHESHPAHVVHSVSPQHTTIWTVCFISFDPVTNHRVNHKRKLLNCIKKPKLTLQTHIASFPQLIHNNSQL